MTNIIKHLHTLTYDDLEDWAGEKIFTRGKGLVNKVSQLEQHGENELTAKVKGTEWYDCSIVLMDGELESDCTCPYYDRCKHVVAVVLAAAKAISADQEIPATQENGGLAESSRNALQNESPNDDDRNSQLEMVEQIQQAMSEAGLTLEQVEALTCPNTEQATDYDPDEYLGDMSIDELNHRLSTTFNALTKAKLVQLLMALAMDHPDTLRYELIERASVLSRKKPASKSQIGVLRRQIKKITAEESWRDNWKGLGHTPDYGPIERGFNQMLEQDQFDDVIELAKEMWPLAIEQVEHSNDEGELAFEVSQAMIPVMAALPQSSIKPAIQILWLMDLEREDDYNLLQDTDLVYNDTRYLPSVWRDVSAVLEKRLDNQRIGKTSMDWSERYAYTHEVNHLLFALEKQGDMESVIRVQMAHIAQTRDYVKLIDGLRKLDRRNEAEQWIALGYHNVLEKEPGTASTLKSRLCDLFMADSNHLAAAALIADDFFEMPRLEDFKKVEQACEPTGVWPPVRSALLAFLESNKLPDPDFDTEWWPLPIPRLTVLNYNANIKKKPMPDLFAHHTQRSKKTLMIDIALYEERIRDAVELYQAQPNDVFISDDFARKTAQDYPDVAAKVYLKWAEQEINKANKEAYQRAGQQLRKMRAVLEKHGRLDEWHKQIVRLQTEHKRKIRLMEVLSRIGASSEKLIDL